jgi:hypothetical protein
MSDMFFLSKLNVYNTIFFYTAMRKCLFDKGEVIIEKAVRFVQKKLF